MVVVAPQEYIKTEKLSFQSGNMCTSFAAFFLENILIFAYARGFGFFLFTYAQVKIVALCGFL